MDFNRFHPNTQNSPPRAAYPQMRIHPELPDEGPSHKPAEAMDFDIYRSSVDRTKLLSVPAGKNPLEISFSADLDPDLHNVRPYKQSVHLQRGQPALGLDVEDIFQQTAARGYAAHVLKVDTGISMGIQIGRASCRERV